MKGFPKGLMFAIFAGAILLTGCSTTETRISEHPEIFQSLSPRDQALVSRGQIRSGMSKQVVWLAWGNLDQKAQGEMRGQPTETWIYVQYADYGPYPYHGYGPGFGYGRIGIYRTHRHRRFAFYGDPFYDPFYYSHIPPRIPIPYKTVTFINGRVVSFQHAVRPYR